MKIDIRNEIAGNRFSIKGELRDSLSIFVATGVLSCR